MTLRGWNRLSVLWIIKLVSSEIEEIFFPKNTFIFFLIHSRFFSIYRIMAFESDSISGETINLPSLLMRGHCLWDVARAGC